jgi:hypothetical protein
MMRAAYGLMHYGNIPTLLTVLPISPGMILLNFASPFLSARVKF